MSIREALSSLFDEKQTEDLYKFISENPLSSVCCNEIGEALTSLTSTELNILWDSFELICESTVLSLFGDNPLEEEKLKQLRLLCNIATIAQKTIVPGLLDIPGGLLQIALLLNGLLLEDLPPKCSKLKIKIAFLNETWWQRKKQGYENFGGNTILFYLKKMFEEQLVKADIKRMWNLREALHTIKYDNRASLELKKYLKFCAVCDEFLEVNLGAKFVSYSLLLNEDIIEVIHLSIKDTLTTWTKKQAKLYAEIYYKAWVSATGPLRQKLEFYCLQDMMQLAMLVDRSTGVFTVLKIFLHYIHMQRGDGKTDMLVRLYEPILWRHLKVPNSDVRANSAAIFFSAFPLEVKREMDNADLLQKQYGIMQDLLMDDNPCVRAIAITGICDACTDYWELIPPSTIQSLLRCFVDDMILDVSSCEVRAAVSVGFAHLLDNPLAHPYLQTLLPKLIISFHDKSEQVRVAVLELLLKTKHLKPFQYWDVVPLEDLLKRLKTDSQPVKKRIMKLIINGFFPETAPTMFLLQRCLQLITIGRRFSLSFYSQVCDFVDIKIVVDFIRFICRYLKRLLKDRKDNSENSNSYRMNQDYHEDDDTSDVGKITDEETRKQNDELFESPERIGGLIDVIIVLWSKILKQKLVVYEDELCQKVRAAMCGLLPFLVSFYKGTVAWNSILYFASYISPKLGSGHILDKYCLSRLRALPPKSKVEDYSTYLSCLFRWGCDEEVLELLSGWLDAALNVKSKSKQQTSGRRVRICDPCEVQPGLACDILSWLLTDPFCRTKLCSGQVNLHSCWNQLQLVPKVIERRIKEGRVPNPLLTSDEFLVNVFSLYCRITIHLDATPGHAPLTVYENLFNWAKNELLPCLLRSSDSLNSSSTRSSVRLAQRTHIVFANSLLKIIFQVCGDMILVGIVTVEFCTQLSIFTKAILLAASDLSLITAVSKFVFHLQSRFIKTLDADKIDTTKDLITELFGSIIHSTAGIFSSSTEFPPEKCKELKMLITEMLVECHEQSRDSPDVVPQMASVGCAVVANMNDMVEKECGYTEIDALSDLPLLSRFLMAIVFTKPSLARSLLNHLHYMLLSGLIKQPSKILALTAILHIIGYKCARVDAQVLKTLMSVASQVVQDALSLCSPNYDDSSLAIDRDYLLTSDHLLAALGDKFA